MQEIKPGMVPPVESIEQLKQDLLAYIEKNTLKIDTNLPVFFGYIISTLEESAKDISDTLYDEFIDEIAFKLIEKSENVHDREFIERVCTQALRTKRMSSERTGIDLAAGVKLIAMGEYQRAITYLKEYTAIDGIIASAVAYCYYMLSLKEIADNIAQVPGRPGEMELLAREQMLFLAQKRPPMNYLSRFQSKDEPELTRAFWLMTTCSLEWFPSEPGFLALGIEKAKKDANKEMRKELLKIANERFFNDLFFLRETYYLNLEERDPIGAASIVKQMLQQYPDDWESIYYGIKLSLLTNTRTTFDTFRKLSVAKGIPASLIHLFDLSFAVISRDREASTHLLSAGKREYHSLSYFLHLLEYLVQDVFSEDQKRSRKAKKTLVDAVEMFCLFTIRRQHHIENDPHAG
ncbi:MAG: hypothetical protein LUO93_03665 [Methanomicrobiales archaeon]|nr:hypothetical protein [Methanomicrobiales archaeon]